MTDKLVTIAQAHDSIEAEIAKQVLENMVRQAQGILENRKTQQQ